MRKVIAAIVLAILILPINSKANETITKKPKWISKVAWAIGICETGKGNSYPDFKHDGGVYEGFVGWYVGTWNLDKPKGYPYHPYDATPRQQNKVMAISMRKHRHFGCYANGGYRVWMK